MERVRSKIRDQHRKFRVMKQRLNSVGILVKQTSAPDVLGFLLLRMHGLRSHRATQIAVAGRGHASQDGCVCVGCAAVALTRC